MGDLPIAANAAIFTVAAIVVWIAGTRIARYADAIAGRTGIAHEAIGMLLLGGVTSLPELAVGITASFTGYAGLSVNNVLGAAAMNVVMLAVADVVIGRDALTSRLASPGVVLQGLLSVLMLAVVVVAVVAGDVVVLGMGIASWSLLAMYGIAVKIILNAKGRGSWVPATGLASVEPVAAGGEGSDASLGRLVTTTAFAGLAIFAAGFLLARTGAALAEQTGLGTNFFGALLLAMATTLPELSTVIGAVRLRRYEMAISDVFGTNLFNMMIIVLVDQLHPGKPVLVEVGAFAAFGALLAIILTVLFLVGMIERRDRTFLRMGIDSLAALLCYAAGLVVLYHLR